MGAETNHVPAEIAAFKTILDRAEPLVGHTEHDDGLFTEIEAVLDLPHLRSLAVDPGSVSQDDGWRRTASRLNSNLGLGVIVTVSPESPGLLGRAVTVLYEQNDHDEVRISSGDGRRVAKVIRTGGAIDITLSGRDVLKPGTVFVRPTPRG